MSWSVLPNPTGKFVEWQRSHIGGLGEDKIISSHTDFTFVGELQARVLEIKKSSTLFVSMLEFYRSEERA